MLLSVPMLSSSITIKCDDYYNTNRRKEGRCTGSDVKHLAVNETVSSNVKQSSNRSSLLPSLSLLRSVRCYRRCRPSLLWLMMAVNRRWYRVLWVTLFFCSNVSKGDDAGIP